MEALSVPIDTDTISFCSRGSLLSTPGTSRSRILEEEAADFRSRMRAGVSRISSAAVCGRRGFCMNR